MTAPPRNQAMSVAIGVLFGVAVLVLIGSVMMTDDPGATGHAVGRLLLFAGVVVVIAAAAKYLFRRR